MAIEQVCTSLEPSEVDGLRAEVSRVLKHSHPHKSDLTNEGQKGMKQLKTDQDWMVIIADECGMHIPDGSRISQVLWVV